MGRPSVLVLAAVGVLGLAPAAAVADQVTVLELLRNPTRFVGQRVTVRGTMGGPVALGPGRPGQTVFELTDEGAAVRVISPIRAPCGPGHAVTVEGRFEPMRNVQGQTLVNVVDASVVVCR